MTELSDEELERRMRAKWDVGTKPKPALMSERDRQTAAALVGRDNVDRFQNIREGRRFRPAPVQVHYEYFEVPGNIYALAQYRIVRVENGRQQDHRWDAFETTMEDEVKRLRAKGFTVRRVYLGDEAPRRDRQPESRKKRILDGLANFKLRRR
ncbi:hypothetical protein GTW25_05830 [Aliihoeflea aestuarii]|jgi:hypothetical protein|uniref:hypothetical protein n=1 Tax=Aliihoeflea aestuarii TaxID=453840 RepID=UPI00209339CA|nr:hypothetical protein [Aliihoeflea aestuarii]MCO6390545.1 hypothetical protein [Aliihoeflea aestuarii]